MMVAQPEIKIMMARTNPSFFGMGNPQWVGLNT